MANPRGKSLKSVAHDVREGFVTVNPLFLRPFEVEDLKGLHAEIEKCLTEVRAEKFPHGDMEAIRTRNLRLQRLYGASMILRNFARAKRIILV
ncbi:MAG: hypothetical protein M0033_11600 [Nitrospiraceae bacterium]|nr:hypothetical protein [Nitrospiraceae bacterium]